MKSKLEFESKIVSLVKYYYFPREDFLEKSFYLHRSTNFHQFDHRSSMFLSLQNFRRRYLLLCNLTKFAKVCDFLRIDFPSHPVRASFVENIAGSWRDTCCYRRGCRTSSEQTTQSTIISEREAKLLRQRQITVGKATSLAEISSLVYGEIGALHDVPATSFAS